MIIKQISIFVENKPGRLAEITEIIAKNDINIRALSVADTTHFGILRIIVDDPEMVQRVLKEAGLTVSITSVITAAINDRPGGLAAVLKLFAAHDIRSSICTRSSRRARTRRMSSCASRTRMRLLSS